MSTIANTLYNLTTKGTPFIWTQKCNRNFQEIKQEIISDRILKNYNPDLPLTLSVDASPVGLGAVLSHALPDRSERPIAFASWTLTQSERNYSQINKEVLGIKWGVDTFFVHLYGRRFILFTGHLPLVHIFGKRKNYLFSKLHAYYTMRCFCKCFRSILSTGSLNFMEMQTVYPECLLNRNIYRLWT